MTTKVKISSKVSLEILELAKEMGANETINEDDFRIVNCLNSPMLTRLPLRFRPKTPELSEKVHTCARLYCEIPEFDGRASLAVGGLKRPTGPALALLNVISRKDIDLVM